MEDLKSLVKPPNPSSQTHMATEEVQAEPKHNETKQLQLPDRAGLAAQA